ncbi:hypothetical protein VUR80DRAFT_8405 [Thermomyces stellatus]
MSIISALRPPLCRFHSVRLYSCEKGNYCDVVKDSPAVWMQPVVARLPDGGEVSEVGVGGGRRRGRSRTGDRVGALDA